jgi:hypothetical protein
VAWPGDDYRDGRSSVPHEARLAGRCGVGWRVSSRNVRAERGLRECARAIFRRVEPIRCIRFDELSRGEKPCRAR